MAPHALIDLNDTSGYYPSTTHKAWSHSLGYHNHSKLPFTEPKASTKIPFANLGFGSRSPPNVWNLSSDEIGEIEKNVRDFLSMCEVLSSGVSISEPWLDLDLPLHAINPTTFPLTNALRSKLRDLTIRTIYGEEQYFIISGLDPYRYSDYQNVIIHAGLSCHVGSKRGMSGRTGGNKTVIR